MFGLDLEAHYWTFLITVSAVALIAFINIFFWIDVRGTLRKLETKRGKEYAQLKQSVLDTGQRFDECFDEVLQTLQETQRGQADLNIVDVLNGKQAETGKDGAKRKVPVRRPVGSATGTDARGDEM